MFQQVLALIIIAFFVARLFWQKQKKHIGASELAFWLVFWILAALAIVFIKQIDILVASLGFSGTGIEILFYLGVVILFYFLFRFRLRLEKMERDITKIVREISIKNNSRFDSEGGRREKK